MSWWVQHTALWINNSHKDEDIFMSSDWAKKKGASSMYVIPMYYALSIFLFAVCNTDVLRTFYININVTSNIYSEILLKDKTSEIFATIKNKIK
jgi:hypothetical protein